MTAPKSDALANPRATLEEVAKRVGLTPGTAPAVLNNTCA